MYLAFLGFREKPFNLTPDPKFLYLNASYREALAALHYGIAERKGFVSLIGEAGTGKTTLLRRLLAELPPGTRSVLVLNPAVGFEELLRFILADLGRPQAAGTTKLQMLETLNAELLDTLARGGNVVVLIDEAQDLTISVLEELRLLSNLETAKEKILQLVLAGQPELDATLARAEIRQLRQRIAVRPRLRPLLWRELDAYVAARVAAAGGDARGLFTRPALLRLWRFSHGVPRLVNVACDNALVTAYAVGVRRVGWKTMGEALRDLGTGDGAWMPTVRYLRPAILLGAATVGGIVGLAVSRLDRGSEPPVLPPTVEAPGAPPAQLALGPAVGSAAPAAAVARAPVAGVADGGGPPPVPGAGASAPTEHAPIDRVDAPLATDDAVPPPPAVVAAAPPPSGASRSAAMPPGSVEARPSVPAPSVAGSIPAVEAGAEASAVRGVDREPKAAPVAPTRRRRAEVLAGVPRSDAPAPVLDGDQTQPDDEQAVDRREDGTGVRVAIQPGDTLGHLAFRHYGYYSPELIREIRRANPGIRDEHRLVVGQRVLLPGGHEVPDEASNPIFAPPGDLP